LVFLFLKKYWLGRILDEIKNMCGIIGLASKVRVINRGWLSVGRDLMQHRGPDGAGEWWSADGCVGLGHRRLAIVDLSLRGQQPMHDSAGELTIVFNGEIYNFTDLRQELFEKGHVFRSAGDTEVILAAYREWGVDCLTRLNGMFAFALYDVRQRKLFVARDRAGEKPFFYSLTDGVFRFASELKGLMADTDMSRHINSEAMDCYLTMGFIPGERCILQGVMKLPAAHALEFNLESGQSRLWRYWQLPMLEGRTTTSKVDESAMLDELEVLIEDAVRRQLVADVDVGVLLSGGVDSSLITAMAARSVNKIKTFTIRFPGYDKIDETEHARLIARHFDTHHTELVALEATAELLPELARQFDEPIVDSSMIPTYLVSKLVAQHCTVALGGDGGDELFGGYQHYSRLLSMQAQLGHFPQVIRRGISLAAERLLPVGTKGRSWLQSIGTDMQNGLPQVSTLFDARTRQRLMSTQPNWFTVAEDIFDGRVPIQPDLLQRATRMDFQNYLVEDILVKVDRASMLSSLEMRSPLLDYRLVEYAFRNVQSQQKATMWGKKILLKRLTERILPKNFDRQRKQGFSIPLADWLKGGPFRDFFNEVLRDPQCIFDMRTVDVLLRGQDSGRNNGERLFALVLFELWRREYRVTY
jgi:asparagine synthase (glutamine-hydrolysing)